MNMTTRFLPWVRRTAISGDALVVRASGRDVSVPISQYGPGDIAGIAPGQIRRRDPLPGSLSMPPNLMPSVEFNSADFPWSVTPGAPNASGQLQPWLALIVVEAPSGSPLATLADAKLPAIEAQRMQLPSPAELSLWAHTQLDASTPATEDVVRRGISRVLAPRALTPNTRYIACLVPSFEAGRLAGLGKPVPDPRSADPAWTNTPGTVLLPVYDSWFFTTCDSGDLETLAQRLRGYDLAATNRPKLLDVSKVSGNVAGKLAPFEGALRPVGSKGDWTGAAVTASANKIRTELEHTPVSGVPVVGLPVYGSIAAGQAKPLPGWLNDLNLDPRRRAAAGLGASMVRQRQEDLVDEAWRQAGDVERARREREGALLADLVRTRLHARMLAPLGGSNALVAMAPALARTRDTASSTLAARVGSSVVPGPVLDAGFRRILATKAPLAARKAGQGIRKSVALLNTRVVSPATLPSAPAKLVTRAKIQLAMNAGAWFPPPPIIQPPIINFPFEARVDFALPSMAAVTPEEQTLVGAYLAELATRQPPIVNIVAPKALIWPTPPAPAGSTAAMARFTTRITATEGARLNDDTGVSVTPRFTQPLAAWLDPSYLLSGIDIPEDAAGLLETNAGFIEALIVGANHELARELLWRGVALNRNSTLLTRFFESQMSGAPVDIKPIAEWKPEEPLGSHFASGERCVMILRTPLVSHLSETVISLVKAEPDGPFRKPGTTQMLPLFRGFAGVDTAYFGFDISPDDLAIEPGWYFVIQELAGATRFGLDEVATPTLTTWNDLAWPNVAVSGGYLAVSQKKPVPTQPKGLEWGKDAAHMAAIILQRPIRLSIHTSLLMPPKS